jgi:probable F420-dependent oxidoreductase
VRFRFGVISAGAQDMAACIGAARRIETLGFDTLLVPDTLNTPAPLPLLAVAAAATTTLRVGTWVLCDAFRNPRVLARDVGCLDQLSGGRVEIGLGVGRPDAAAEARRLNVAFGSPGERIRRLGETIEIVRDELRRDRLDHAGGVGRVPILVAAGGPRLLEMAGRLADIVAFGWLPATTPEIARPMIDRVRDAAADRADDVELAAGLVAVGPEQHPWLQRMGLDPAALAAAGAVTVVAGSAREMADELLRRRDSLGLSYFTVPIQSADAFAPVVELLAGQ